MRDIRIRIGDRSFRATLNDTLTARLLWEAMPFYSDVARWGDELYFASPVHGARQDAVTSDVSVGDMAFWPPGNAFCIFFGPTPGSNGAPRPLSPVVLIGRIDAGPEELRRVRDGEPVRVEAIEPAPPAPAPPASSGTPASS
jgi:hypothetical protein